MLTYWIHVYVKGEPTIFEEALLPFIPERVVKLTNAQHVDNELGLCELCDMDEHCHPINSETGEKYCTVLFHDLIKPKWKIKQVV